jgi:DNA-binding beta-propeller fold protein YncE
VSASPGAQLWAKRYNGPGNSTDIANSLAVSPTGGAVYVTGQSSGATTGDDYATVAYNAATGAQLWVSRYSHGADVANSVAVSPTGGTVYVTGQSSGATTGYDYATIAYKG